jgi:hypothetical protein
MQLIQLSMQLNDYSHSGQPVAGKEYSYLQDILRDSEALLHSVTLLNNMNQNDKQECIKVLLRLHDASEHVAQ